jgi:hypothetical protein
VLSTIIFQNSARTHQSSNAGIRTSSSPEIVSDMRERGGERGLTRTRSDAVPVVLNADDTPDALSRDGGLGSGKSSLNAGQMV